MARIIFLTDFSEIFADIIPGFLYIQFRRFASAVGLADRFSPETVIDIFDQAIPDSELQRLILIGITVGDNMKTDKILICK